MGNSPSSIVAANPRPSACKKRSHHRCNASSCAFKQRVGQHYVVEQQREQFISSKRSVEYSSSNSSNSSEEMIPDDQRDFARNDRSADIDNGDIISPKKPPHPSKDVPELRDLHRELAFNNKMGINVLGQKSELKKAMEKMRDQVGRKREDEVKKQSKSDLEAELERRALRLKEIENALAESSGGSFPTPDDEFHRIHAKVNGRFASATS